jgi:hypothetical protein
MHPLVIIGAAIAGALYLAREKKAPPLPPSNLPPAPPVINWNAPPPASQQHLHAGASLITAENLYNVIGADYDNTFDCAGDVDPGEPFIFDYTHMTNDYRYGGHNVDSREGVNFKQTFMRQIWWPASRLELSKHVSAAHVALCVGLLKSFPTDMRNGPWNCALDTAADTAEIGTTAVKMMTNLMQGLTQAPIVGYMGQATSALISIFAGLFEASNKEWQHMWQENYRPPEIEMFLQNGYKGEWPLEPQYIYGGGSIADNTADLQYELNTWGSAMGVWVNQYNPYTGQPVTRVAGPWITSERDYSQGNWTAERNNRDVYSRYPPNHTVWIRGRLFTPQPMAGSTVLGWPGIGNQMPVRDRINVFARVYRAMDALIALHSPLQEKLSGFYTWTDPKLGKVQGSIFKATPLQDPGPLTIQAIPGLSQNVKSAIIKGLIS